MDEETKTLFNNHEQRLKKIESSLFPEGKQSIKHVTKNYKGLAGGIRLLIDEGFLDEPRFVDEIMKELKRKGYHKTFEGVSSTLSETFMKSQGVLDRFKEKGKWKYVLRK